MLRVDQRERERERTNSALTSSQQNIVNCIIIYSHGGLYYYYNTIIILALLYCILKETLKGPLECGRYTLPAIIL